MRSRALSMVRKKIGFGQVIKMIDDLFAELKKEQQIDNSNEHFAANGQPGSVFLIWRCERAFFQILMWHIR